MTKNYKIVTQFLKDISSETPDVETYFFVKNNISNYQLVIDITSKALKNKHVEIDTIFKFRDNKENIKKSYFEMFSLTYKYVSTSGVSLEASLINLAKILYFSVIVIIYIFKFTINKIIFCIFSLFKF